MTDFKMPDLPSDDELGITEEDLRAFDEESRTQGETHAEGGPPAPPPGGGADRGGRVAPKDEATGWWRGPLMLLAMVALGGVASVRTGLPDVVPAGAPATEFSAVRAMTALNEIVREPRPIGSPEHTRVRNELVERLRALGLDPEVQTATAIYETSGFARAATVRNVVARIPGADPTGAVLLTAHYDGTELSPGAGDDASGLVTILEAVRASQASEPLRNDVIILFTDAEEIGLLGAEAFVRDHPWMEDVQAVVALEMRGSSGPSLLFETADGNGAVVGALDASGPYAFGTSLGEEFFRYLPNSTDFSVFERAGKQGLNFAAIDNAAVYHTPRDLPSELSDRTLQHHGSHALAALRGLGGLDLADIQASDVVYFTLPVLGFVTYPARWVLPLSALLALAAVGVFLLARRRGARVAGVVAGFGVSVIALSLGYGAGYVLVDQSLASHVEAGRLPGALFYNEGWYVMALAAASLFVVGLLFGVARRRLSIVELALGGLVLPVTAAIGLGFAAPLAAMQLQWPALAAVLCAGALVLLGSRRQTLVGWAVTLLFAVPVIFFLVPAVEMLWLAGTLRQAGALGALMVISLLLALPAVDALRAPNGWWMPLLTLVLGAAFVGLARLGNEVSGVSPIPSTLAYTYERGEEHGMWITDEGTARAAADSQLGRWLAARTGSPFDRTLDLGDVGYRTGPTPVVEAPPAATPPLVTEIRRDTTVGIVRRVTLAVRSQIGAERLHFRSAGGATGTRIASVNGQSLRDPFGVQWVDHWGVPDSSVVLDLEMPAGADMDLRISEHHLRPSEILGPGTFQRPPELEPDVLRWSDRAIFTTHYERAPARAESIEPNDTLSSPPATDGLPPDTLTLPDTLIPSEASRPPGGAPSPASQGVRGC